MSRLGRLIAPLLAMPLLGGCLPMVAVGIAAATLNSGTVVYNYFSEEERRKVAIETGYLWCSDVQQPRADYNGRPCLIEDGAASERHKLVVFHHSRGDQQTSPAYQGGVVTVRSPNPDLRPCRTLHHSYRGRCLSQDGGVVVYDPQRARQQ